MADQTSKSDSPVPSQSDGADTGQMDDKQKNEPTPLRDRDMAGGRPETQTGPRGKQGTPMDGNPDLVPSQDDPSGLKPRDDTPFILPKKEGPKPS